MKEKIEIRLLADCPGTIPVLAGWIYAEWGEQYRIESVAVQVEAFRMRTNRDRFPLAVVAFRGAQPVGTASLKLREMTTHTHLPHWLGAVYVAKDWRNVGIGTALITRAATMAQELGVKTLYLHTADRTRLYARLGWSVIEQCEYSGHQVAIMKRELAQPATAPYSEPAARFPQG